MIVPNYILDELEKQVIRRKSMPKVKKTTTRKRTTKQKEFSFFTRVVSGAKRIFSPKY
jgi:hypothetical protein